MSTGPIAPLAYMLPEHLGRKVQGVSDVQVDCSTDSFSIGGTISGLAGTGLVLRNNGGDDLTILANGSFNFATALLDLSTYSVSITVQPGAPGQICQLSSGSGTLSGSNVTSISIICKTI